MLAFSNAKINLGLNIIEKRSDGYHNIETIFIPIALYDILEIIPSQKDELVIYGIKTEIQNNTCIKALKELRKYYSIPPVKIILYKNIPIQSGLGGGSSNATFTLILLKKLFNLQIEDDKLLSITSTIGSDCPFFIYNKPMLARAKGDKLSNLDISLKNFKVCIIAHKKIKISTKWAYSLIIPKKTNSSLEQNIRSSINEWKEKIKNDFETYVFAQYPELRKIKEYLYKKGAIYASMSGSGSSIYGIFQDKINLSFPNTYVYWCDFI